MDQAIVAQLGVAGVLVVVLIGGLRWLAAQLQKRLDDSQEQCVERETRLVARLQACEDQQRADSREVIAGAIEALKTNARAFEKLANTESGSHRTRGNQ